MGDVVDLKPVNLAENNDFVADCCRFQEGILTEANMKLKYRFADSVWQDLGSNEKLLEAVEEEKIRRIRTGRSKRENAQLLVTKAPDVVSAIMLDPTANPRHRIDSAKALDDFAGGPEAAAAAAADRFVITINLGGDVEHYNKSITICADDTAPNDGTTAPQKVIANRPWDDGDDVVAARAQKNIKAIEREAGRVEKTPEQIALESMMRY